MTEFRNDLRGAFGGWGGVLVSVVALSLAGCRSTPEVYDEPLEQHAGLHALPLPRIDTLREGANRLTDALISLELGNALAQSFVAPHEQLTRLEVVATVGTAAAHRSPMYVEVRDTDLSRRFGHGRILAETAPSEEPAWASVVWDQVPQLEAGGEYRVVLFTGADQSWILGASKSDTYPDGRLWTGAPDGPQNAPADLALRLTFGDDNVVEAGVSPPPDTVPSDVYDTAHSHQCSYGLHVDPRGPYFEGRLAHLPQCIGDRCVDFRYELLPDEEERRARAAAAYEKVGDSRIRLAPAKPAVVGVSCEDACAATGFATCRAATVRHDAPQGDVGWYKRHACDAVVSAVGHASTVGCLCSDDPREVQTVLTNEQAVATMVRENFRLLRDGSIETKEDAAPFGVTCGQVREVLGAGECAEDSCDRLVTPWSTVCPAADSAGARQREANRQTIVADDYFIVPRGGAYYVVDVDGSVRKTTDVAPDSDRRIETAGPFLIQKPADEADSPTESVDLRDLTRRSFKPLGRWCRYAFDQETLIRSCHEDSVTAVQTLVPAGNTVRLPASDRYLRPVSFDGNVFVGVDNWNYRHRWHVGTNAATRLERPPQHRCGYAYRTKKELDDLYQRQPNAPQFAGTKFFAAWDGHVWAYDLETSEAVAWQAPEWSRGGRPDLTLDIEDGLIRLDEFVYEPTSNTFRYADIAAVAWDGGRALSDNCPPDTKSVAVKKPLDDLCIVEVDASTMPHGRVLNPVPAKPKY